MNAQTRIPYLAKMSRRDHGRDFSPDEPAPLTNEGLLTNILFIFGMILLPLQSVQIGIAQPAHVWMLVTAAIGLLLGRFRLTGKEGAIFALFIIVMLAATFLQDFGRVKATEQIIKFCVIYPGFYCVGRWFGSAYSVRKLPLGYIFLFAMLAVQYFIQLYEIPSLYKELDFGQGALHGSFKERNWLAVYFVLFSYVLFLQTRSTPAFLMLIGLNGVASLLSGSKTALIACGAIFLMHGRTFLPLKILLFAAAAAFYWWNFSTEFSAEHIQVRLEDERGLAFQYATDLLKGNIFGYGVGFVEWHFTYQAGTVMGLGPGTNAVFCTPVDLMIIAGLAGLLAWLMFFLGIGLEATGVLLPIAMLSLFNPMHGSETVYLFIGMLISIARSKTFKEKSVELHRSEMPRPRAVENAS
jgi:hypothetical protein